MSEWEFAQANPEQQLALVHHFSMLKQQEGGPVEFVITVKQFLTPKDPAMSYFAQADKQTNQGGGALYAGGVGSNAAVGAGAVHAGGGEVSL